MKYFIDFISSKTILIKQTKHIIKAQKERKNTTKIKVKVMDAFVAIFLSNVNKLLGYQRKEVSSFIESQMNSELEHCIDEILNKFDEITNGKTKSRNRTIEVTLENLCKIKKLGMLIDETKNLLVYLTQLPSDAIDKTICDEYKRKILLIKGQIGTYQSQFSSRSIDGILQKELNCRIQNQVIGSRMTRYIAKYWVVAMAKHLGAQENLKTALSEWKTYFCLKGKRLDCFLCDEDACKLFLDHIAPILQKDDIDKLDNKEIESLVAQLLDKLEELSKQQAKTLSNENDETFERRLIDEYSVLKKTLEGLTMNAEGSSLLQDKELDNIKYQICTRVMEDYRFYKEYYPELSLEDFVSSKQGRAIIVFRIYQCYKSDSALIRNERGALQKQIERETGIYLAQEAQIKVPILLEEQVVIGKNCVINGRCIIRSGTRVASGSDKMVFIDENVYIGENCVIEGLCSIGKNCIIEEGCKIGKNVSNFTMVMHGINKSISQQEYNDYINEKFKEVNL